jgi:hypothetical protein
MIQRGRKSSSALAVVDDLTGVSPAVAPPCLSDAERGVWVETVNSKPVDWFGTEHIPLLVEYVRHVCRASVIDEQMRAFDAERLATKEGLIRYEKLTSMAIKTAGMVNRLCTSMRLTHQAIYHPDKVGMGPGKGNGRKLWQREAA